MRMGREYVALSTLYDTSFTVEQKYYSKTQ